MHTILLGETITVPNTGTVATFKSQVSDHSSVYFLEKESVLILITL